jgi:hypothetical protein
VISSTLGSEVVEIMPVLVAPEYEIGEPQRIRANWARSLKRLPLSHSPSRG